MTGRCRAEWAFATAAWLVSCAPAAARQTGEIVRGTSPSAAARPAPPAEGWPLVRVSDAWPVLATGFVSEGHAVGHCAAEVRVSPAVADRYRSWTAGAEAPVGTVLIERCREPGSPARATVYGMEKNSEGAWTYVVASQDGAIREQGPLELCSRCHAEAVSDSVFGLPRSLRASPSSQRADTPGDGTATGGFGAQPE